MNYKNIKYWLLDLRPDWQMVQHIRGVTRDRKGKLYWLCIREYQTDDFLISLYPWPGLTYSSSMSAGWISVGGTTQSPMSWEIYDVRVDRPQYKQRGVGTVLVKAAIALARRRGVQDLHGRVTSGDARNSPFLPAWYARLGFTVQFSGVVETDPWGLSTHATFRMDLSLAASSP